MTVDEILATGEYRDRTGRVWVKCPVNPRDLNDCWWAYGRPVPGNFEHRGEDHIRLLIERDQHRDVCPGLQTCKEHPVPYVWIGVSGSPYHEPAWGFNDGDYHDTLPEAMDAARALAVGE